LILAYGTHRALEIIRQIFKGCAGIDVQLWQTFLRVIDPAANIAYIFVHAERLLSFD
jgi:hypothetical protein